MDFELIKNKKLENKYKVKIASSEIEVDITKKIMEIQPELQLKGFRKGQVPTSLIRKLYGKNILGEVVQNSVENAVTTVLKENNHTPAAQPKIEMLDKDWKEGNDLTLEVEYECLPTFKEMDFSKIKLVRFEAKVEKKSVESALDELAVSASDFIVKKNTSKCVEKDQVVLDFVGKVDKEEFEGGTATDYPLVVGSNSFIPGFEEQLIGVKKGDKKKVKVTFPDNYGNAKLAGKKAIFDCNIKELKEPVKAKIDDELAKKYGVENIKELKAQIESRIKNEYSEASSALLKKKLMDEIDKKIKTDLPEQLVENEAKSIAQQLSPQSNADATEVKDSDHAISVEHTKLARRRVKLGLFVAHVGRVNKIEISDEELNQFIMRQASQYPGREKEYLDFVSKNPQAKEQAKSPIFEEKVINFIIGSADVSSKAITVEKLKKELEELEKSE